MDRAPDSLRVFCWNISRLRPVIPQIVFRRLFTALVLLSWGNLRADDRVIVQTPGQSSRITVIGRIADFNGRELVLHTSAGAGVQRIPANEVIEVFTDYLPEHQTGLQKLNAGDVEVAWENLSIALEEEPRAWVRREILAAQVQCAMRSGDFGRAANRFLAITAADELSPHFHLIPLVWTESAPGKLPESEALRWMNGNDLSAKLIAASWLWTVSGRRTEAETALKSLAGEAHPFIQRLAQAQLWRARLETGTLSAAEIQRWEQFTESLPEVLRGGPYFLIGRAYADRQDWLAAASAWLWLPFEYPLQRYLSVEAQWRAAQALQMAGDTPAAVQLAQEITARYADTPQALEASALVENARKRENPSP